MESAPERPDHLGRCPKCGRERRPTEQACARCGLLVVRWPGFSDESGARDEPPELAERWARCLADWSDERAHDALFDAAYAAGSLPALARRYRRRLDEVSGGDPMSEARLRRIALLVESAARAQSERVVSRGTTRALQAAGILVAVLVLVASLLVLLRGFGRS